MATVDQTLTDLIRSFPCAYPDRTQALHQVLVVLGAGYAWQGGEVVQRFDSDGSSCRRVHGMGKVSADAADRLCGPGETISREDRDGTCPSEHLRSRAVELARTPGPLRQDPYPSSTLAPLFNIPEDAAADRVESAREIAEVIVPLWANPSPYELALTFSYTAEQRTYARRQHERALALLEHRFGSGWLSGGPR
ncbi:hypothetical protein MHW47_00005 [Streptomyces sp. OfavH-34-F]|uniref:hypothetical protein n=1 Tax=Streptomyces sp. OfavH-34-F TaxID=2917760 RepID=UPI001EF24924|nr:hypothetical protein [Streptomyces sp. OfavH-34-F]MCG7522837.1 hypothetical protein [Streptomyces sp. OfavH-34-F]